MLISSSTQFQYLKTTPQSDLVQNKLIPTSLGTDLIENERFELVFAKTIIFVPKTGSINSGTGIDSQIGDPVPRGGADTFLLYVVPRFVMYTALRLRVGQTCARKLNIFL